MQVAVDPGPYALPWLCCRWGCHPDTLSQTVLCGHIGSDSSVVGSRMGHLVVLRGLPTTSGALNESEKVSF